MFEKLLDGEIKKIDGPTKAKTISQVKNSQTVNSTAVMNVSPVAAGKTRALKSKRKPISITIKRRVYQKAGYQCEYISPLTRERCPKKRFLTIDHIRPIALGGTNEESNARCLCKSHNLSEAQRMGLKIPKRDSKNL